MRTDHGTNRVAKTPSEFPLAISLQPRSIEAPPPSHYIHNDDIPEDILYDLALCIFQHLAT